MSDAPGGWSPSTLEVSGIDESVWMALKDQQIAKIISRMQLQRRRTLKAELEAPQEAKVPAQGKRKAPQNAKSKKRSRTAPALDTDAICAQANGLIATGAELLQHGLDPKQQAVLKAVLEDAARVEDVALRLMGV